MAALRPQGLLLLEGINDLNNRLVSTTAVVNALAQMIDVARLYNTTVFISTMFQSCVSTRPDGSIRENAADRVVPFNTALRAMATGRQNVYVVDMYGAFGNNCGPDRGRGAARRRRAPSHTERLLRDGRHVFECAAHRLCRARLVPVRRAAGGR